MWIKLLDPFALHAPFHHLRLADFGLVEKDMLCAIMTITAELIWVPYEVSLGVFLLMLYHIANNFTKGFLNNLNSSHWNEA